MALAHSALKSVSTPFNLSHYEVAARREYPVGELRRRTARIVGYDYARKAPFVAEYRRIKCVTASCDCRTYAVHRRHYALGSALYYAVLERFKIDFARRLFG